MHRTAVGYLVCNWISVLFYGPKSRTPCYEGLNFSRTCSASNNLLTLARVSCTLHFGLTLACACASFERSNPHGPAGLYMSYDCIYPVFTLSNTPAALRQSRRSRVGVRGACARPIREPDFLPSPESSSWVCTESVTLTAARHI